MTDAAEDGGAAGAGGTGSPETGRPEGPGRLAGSGAIVTGAGSGIGRATALALAGEGARVALLGRREDALHSAAREIEAAGFGAALVLPCDVSREEDVKRAVGEAVRAFSWIRFLVNNAGYAAFEPVASTSTEAFDRTLAVNLRGPFLVLRETLPQMPEDGSAAIVNVLSVAAVKPFKKCGVYAASKAGLLALGNVLREELRPRRIRVTSFLAGATDTGIWGEAGAKHDRGRMMKPADVAAMILAVCLAPPGAAPEEVVLRPPGGDL